MVRSFLPVGQGAFYCECFEGDNRKINIVYDCGSLTDVKIVEKEIRNYFQKGEIIDALFISHLDEDHINGIPFLLKYCKVKKIYFPLITSANKKIMGIYFRASGASEFIADFLDDPRRAIDALNIDYRPEFTQIDEADIDDMEPRSDNIDVSGVESGTNISIDIDIKNFSGRAIYSKWLYIPFNFRQKDRIDILMNELREIYGRRITEDEVESLWRIDALGDRDRIRKAYKKVPGNFNTNSMTLFSGEIFSQFRQYENSYCPKYCLRYCGYRSPIPSGCLYTGDYDASGEMKWVQLINAYKKYWKHIGCVQIPHHGSSHNFNPKFLDMDAFFVISCGYSNKYRHPHAYVIKSFLLKFIFPHIVTENVGSAAFYVIE